MSRRAAGPDRERTLETARLLLRSAVASDAAALMAVFGDAEVMRFGDGVRDEPWVRAWLTHDPAPHGRPAHRVWTVFTRAPAEVIGYCGLFHYPDVNGRAETELGYRLAKAAWGRGYATEAARALRDHAFDDLGITRLVALIDPANRGSRRVAEKLGMIHASDTMLEGYTHPDHVYAVERTDR